MRTAPKLRKDLCDLRSLSRFGALDIPRQQRQCQYRHMGHERDEDEGLEVAPKDRERLFEKVAQLLRGQCAPALQLIRPSVALGPQGHAARYAEARLVGVAPSAGYAAHCAASPWDALSAEPRRTMGRQVPKSAEDGSVGRGRFNLLDTHRHQWKAVDPQQRRRFPRPVQFGDHLTEQARGGHHPLQRARQLHNSLHGRTRAETTLTQSPSATPMLPASDSCISMTSSRTMTDFFLTVPISMVRSAS